MLFLLTGCPSEADPDPTPQPPPKPAPPAPPPKVPESIVEGVVRELFKRRQLKFSRGRDELEKELDDQHKGFFIRRRIRELLALNPAWNGDLAKLTQRIEAELDAVEAYLSEKLTETQLGGAVEAGSPPKGSKTAEWAPAPDKHLNLEDAAYATTKTQDAQARLRTRELVVLRRKRVRAIVWRAAAIHDALWNPSGAQFVVNAALVRAKVDEVLDRRLRVVERMATQVATHNYIDGGYANPQGETESTSERPLRVTGPNSWLDGFRGRPFEYPRVGVQGRVVASIGAANIASATTRAFDPSDPKPWRYGKGNSRLEYNVPPTGLQLRSELTPHWRQRFKETFRDSYDVNLIPVPPMTPAAAVDLLWQSKFNWWDRSWLFCDHVLSALHVEALLFAMRRANRLAEFDQMGTRLEFIQLSGHVGQRDIERLMAGGSSDKYFENFDASEGDLQVGDQLIMWNSFVYAYVADGEWQLENALVTDLVSDPKTGGIIRERLTLQGHGTQARRYPNYQRTIASPLQTALSHVHAEIEENPARTSFEYQPVGTTVVKWSPYDAFSEPGAWWLVLTIPRRNVDFNTIDALKAAIPRAVAVSDFANPTNSFPLTISGPFALFPLYEPKFKKPPAGVSNLWLYYAGEHQKADGARPLARLQPVIAAGDLLPTLYKAGSAQPLPIVRPKAST